MERYSYRHKKHHRDRKNRVGIIFLIIGLVLLGRNLHFIPGYLYPTVFSWPMLLIAIGVGKLILRGRNAGGLVLIAIGGLFLWDRILPLSQMQWAVAWPGLFIIVGVLLVFGYLIKSSNGTKEPKPKKKSKYDDIEFDIDKIEPIES